MMLCQIKKKKLRPNNNEKKTADHLTSQTPPWVWFCFSWKSNSFNDKYFNKLKENIYKKLKSYKFKVNENPRNTAH
jgi:hypothetical protein